MSDREVNVKITADASGFGPQLQQAAGLVESFATDAQGALSGVVSKAKELNAAFAGLAALGAVTGALAEVANKVTEMGVSFTKAAQQTGISATALSSLAFVAKASDVGFQSMVKGLEMLDRGLAQAAKGSGPASNALKVLGVDAHTATGQLKSNEQLLNELADKFASFKDSPEKTALAMQLFGRSGAEMLPILNLGSKGIKQLQGDSDALGATMHGPLLKATEDYHGALNKFHLMLQGIANAIAEKVLPIFTAMVQGFAEGVIRLEHGFYELGLVVVAFVERAYDAIHTVGAAIAAAVSGNFAQAAGLLTGLGIRVKQAWDTTRDAVVADANAMQDAIVAIYDKAPGEKDGKRDAPPGLDPDAARKARELYEQTLFGAYRDAFALRIAQLKEDEQAVTGNAVQEAQQVLAIKQQELQQILAFYGQYSVEAIHAEGDVARATKELSKAMEEASKKSESVWKTSFQQIGSTFDTVFDGLLRGTQTFRQAFGNLVLGLGADFAKILTKMAAQWAAHLVAGEIAQKASAINQVTTDAAVGTAGAEAAVAMIPFVGPALAPAAGAETGALILSNLAGISARGGYDIPAGVNPVTQLHQSEMVLPASLAEKIRGMTDGGGGTHHYHIHAMDSKSFEDFARRNPSGFAKGVKAAVHHGALALSPAGVLR